MFTPDLIVRPARPDDAAPAAAWAEAKRAEYARYSPVFWRPAADARAKHQPFLRFCIQDGDFAAFSAEAGGALVGVALANHRGAPAPFRAEQAPTWFVDDFYVADAAHWPTAGLALLMAVGEAAGAAGAARVVVVVAQRDEPKRALLRSAGYTLEAAWWTHPLAPMAAPFAFTPPAPEGIAAVVAPAPPVYDPDGLVALALALDNSPCEAPAAQVARFGEWATNCGAVLAVVPARTADVALGEALASGGYTVASEWYVRGLDERGAHSGQ
jgi:RimJ/RimL family protein N-acetyltransferase